VDYLLKNTNCEVLGISRSPEYPSAFLPYLYESKIRPECFFFHQADLIRDLDKVFGLLDDFQPDAVVNFAAQGEVRNSWRWPDQWYETNTLSVVRVTEFLKGKDYLKRYVAISTPEVYGTTGEQVVENHCYHPSTPYAASKLAGDLHCFALHKRYGFPVVFTRAANLYGIHQQLYRIIPRTAIYLKMGKSIELHGRGQARRAFIHARDVADLTWRAMTVGRSGEVYHLAPDDSLRCIADVVAFICRQMGHPFESSVTMLDENFGQDALFSLDNSKSKIELGWSQQVAFEEGVKETIEWIESNWDIIRHSPLKYIHKR
jgi:dTDP-glucose 4,6-dehydratase